MTLWKIYNSKRIKFPLITEIVSCCKKLYFIIQLLAPSFSALGSKTTRTLKFDTEFNLAHMMVCLLAMKRNIPILVSHPSNKKRSQVYSNAQSQLCFVGNISKL